MARPGKNKPPEQLGFDLAGSTPPPVKIDLRAAPPIPRATTAAPEIFTIREITTRIRRTLESTLGTVWVRGEISNHRRQASGHHYFTLKDDSSQLACVLFAGDARSLRGLTLRDGLEVRARGDISLYEARGQIQMVVRLLEEVGQGALQARFAALKEKLAAVGLFAPERKRPLPPFPKRIGLITSPTGAALRDFLNVLWRRSPGIELILCPVRVQGTGAASEMVAALESLNQYSRTIAPLDAIVLTRGGGSLEDLWEFNEESLARAIAASDVPTVSAVGHEIDFTIGDFVADFRAPTPSAAAEILSADTVALRESLRSRAQRLRRAISSHGERLRLEMRRLHHHRAWTEPARRIRELRLLLDQHAQTLRDSTSSALDNRLRRLDQARLLLRARHPARHLSELARRLDAIRPRLVQAARLRVQTSRKSCESLAQLLRAFAPQQTLRRGYTLVRAPDGTILTTAAAARRLPRFEIVFSDSPLPVQPAPPDPVK